MPGAAATAGIVQRCVAVMTWPSILNSSSVVVLEVRERKEAHCHRYHRGVGYFDDAAILLDRPVRPRVWPVRPARGNLHDRLLADKAPFRLGYAPATQPGGSSRPGSTSSVVRVLGVAAHFVEFDTQRVTDHANRLGEKQRRRVRLWPGSGSEGSRRDEINPSVTSRRRRSSVERRRNGGLSV
jgi:hypothetical protein